MPSSPRTRVAGARTNAEAAGLEIVYDKSYPPSTTDFTPIIRAIQATNPDVVYVGVLSAGFRRHGAGGQRARPQDQAVRRRHGRPAVREPADQPRADAERHRQLRLLGAGADPRLPGHPGVPGQVSGARRRARASIRSATICRRSPTPTCRSWARRSRRSGSLDQAGDRRAHPRQTTFETVVGPVKFGPNGEWANLAGPDGAVPEHRDRRSRAVQARRQARRAAIRRSGLPASCSSPTPKPGSSAASARRPSNAAPRRRATMDCS